MIAKFTWSLLLTLGTAIGWGQSVSTKEFHYYYQVAHDFDIHPPELEYGYPWWYDSDTLPVTGIIFLKEDLAIPLEKLNDTAWVAEPTEVNAKEIWASSEIQGLPKFYIVPDSSLSNFQVFDFLERLVSDIGIAKFLFCSGEGNFSVLNFDHYPPVEEWICGFGIYRKWLEIRVNMNFDFLIEMEFSSLDSLERIVFEAYSTNFEEARNEDHWRYKRLDKEYIEEKINSYEEMQMTLSGDIRFIDHELSQLILQLAWYERYSFFHEIDKTALIRLEMRGNELSIWQTYSIFNEINKGLFSARNEICLRQSYFELFVNRQFDKLNFIHAQMPDLITDYERKVEVLNIENIKEFFPAPPEIPDPPVTPTPEDSEIYKAMMNNPNLSHDPIDVLVLDSIIIFEDNLK